MTHQRQFPFFFAALQNGCTLLECGGEKIGKWKVERKLTKKKKTLHTRENYFRFQKEKKKKVKIGKLRENIKVKWKKKKKKDNRSKLRLL